MENVLLTGVTGILGRHILYELLRLYASGEKEGHIILIVRPDATGTAEERVRSLLFNHFRPRYLDEYPVAFLLSFITIISTAIDKLTGDHRVVLRNYTNLYVIHAAGCTRLTNDDRSLQEVYHENYQTTMWLLRRLGTLIRRFIYIGTTYACGLREGEINDDYITVSKEGEVEPFPGGQPYRNHYEYLKRMTEHSVATWCKRKNINWQVLRPAAICGRLIDEPLYYISQFNVFYDFGRFLYKWLKNENANSIDNVKQFRVVSNPEIALNIIPVDYAARVIVALYSCDDVRQYNIVSSYPTPIGYMLPYMANALGLPCNMVDTPPAIEEMNALEYAYYQKASAYMTSYFTGPLHYFYKPKDASEPHDVAEVNVLESFDALYAYACHHKFEEPVKN
ncbi:MAG TPA: SDR family oxidoreductase [Chitinophaga sp.]|uniref:SDR family oxidoreductase n=1 Tax=Chitinophaga sp. TaxID=1869181 RepID=UPI002B889580|nr:SDR family oxidoreductase [Chitinophaga sp.]HVI44244.1 SDR family oxidoreductase [Chitinophaga sp.]